MACPVCFSGGEGPIVDGSNMAIGTLLAITVSVLGACAAFIIRLARRGRDVRLKADATDGALEATAYRVRREQC